MSRRGKKVAEEEAEFTPIPKEKMPNDDDSDATHSEAMSDDEGSKRPADSTASASTEPPAKKPKAVSDARKGAGTVDPAAVLAKQQAADKKKAEKKEEKSVDSKFKTLFDYCDTIFDRLNGLGKLKMQVPCLCFEVSISPRGQSWRDWGRCGGEGRCADQAEEDGRL